MSLKGKLVNHVGVCEAHLMYFVSFREAASSAAEQTREGMRPTY